MKRQHIIGIMITVAVVGGIFAVYQFYLKERLQAYADDQLKLEQLTEKYNELQEKFNNTQPKLVIEDVKNRVVPWEEAVDERAEYFHMGDLRKNEPVPDDIFSYKIYYMQRAPEEASSFMEYLRSEDKYDKYPFDGYFGAPSPDEVNDLSPTKPEVGIWLAAMQFGQECVKIFVDANAISLTRMNMWQPWVDQQVLKSYTIGAEFEMTMEDLVAFLDQLRFDNDQYFDVNAIRIKNPYLKGPWAEDPWLKVEMLLTMAEYDPTATVRINRSAAGAVGSQGGGLFGIGGDDDDDEEEREAPKRSILDRIVRLFPF